jgi:hypothetical protein
MSIEIGYNEDGELFIRSDSDTLKWSWEMRLDVVVDTPPVPAPASTPEESVPPQIGLPPSAPPLSAPPVSVPQPTRSKSVRWPKPPPGVMAIIQARSRSTTEPLKWSFLDLDRFHPAISMPLIQLQGTSAAALRQQLALRPKSLGDAPIDTLFTVEVQASLLRQGRIPLNDLESLVNDANLGFTGIRLVFAPDPDPTP